MGRVVGKGSRAQRAVQWGRRLERHAQAGGSVAAFCAREAVAEASFYYWRKKLNVDTGGEPAKASSPVQFIDLGLTRAADDRAGDAGAAAGRELEVQIELGGGVVLRIVRR